MTRMPRINRPSAPRTQQGAVLIVSLMILLVLTIIGINAMQTSTLEEKMASNARDRNIGLQSAEVALREAEDFLESLVTTGNFNNTNALYDDLGNEPDPFAEATWTTTGQYRAATAPGGSEGAQYFITRTGTVEINPGGGGGMIGFPGAASSGVVTIFRATARGQGATGAEVILRSHFGRQM